MRALALLALVFLASCEQITGVKPKPVDCAKPDTVSIEHGLRFTAPKLGCLRVK